jgi:hypothetical protein
VLIQAARDGVALLTWQSDTFAFAETYDEGTARYRGLRGGKVVSLGMDSPGLLVKPDVARKQLDAELGAPPSAGSSASRANDAEGSATRSENQSPNTASVLPFVADRPRRFHGTVTVDPTRVGRDASRIADEVIAHLAGQVGAQVTVTIEIDARLVEGASDQLVRTITENSRTLKFTSQAFEDE